MPVPLPTNVSAESGPAMPRRAQAPLASVPTVAMPRRAQAPLAPIPSVATPRARSAGNQTEQSPFSPLSTGNDLGKVVSLLEKIAHGQGREHGMEQPESVTPSGPVQERGWQTLFNGMPMDQDEQGNSILRRR